MITIHLRVKFRAFYVTFLSLDKVFQVNVGVFLPAMPESVLYNDRGVYLAVRI